MNVKLLRLLLLCIGFTGLLGCSQQYNEQIDKQAPVPIEHTRSPACGDINDKFELLLCENTDLGTLNARLKDLNARATAQGMMPALPTGQTAWSQRNTACLESAAALDCIRENYQNRISELQITTGSATISGSANYLCNDDIHEYITAVFYNQTEVPTVVLTRVSDRLDSQRLAYRVASGSGAKYRGEDIMFWSKGESAQIVWGEKPLSCTQQAENTGGI